ncbi:MAG: hypothetical protein JW719_14385 [Pirellulales bacterium]|nr:hypothetical protein [Pirellulales bacterium]
MADVQQPLPQQKPRKSWFGRNWWWVLILVIVGGGLLCCAVCGGIIFSVFAGLRKSEPYQMTLKAVTSDPVVIEKLGEPISDTWAVAGEYNQQNGEGKAKFMFPVTGPNGAAQVTSEARKSGGKWTLTYIEVVFGDQQKHTIELAPTQGEGGLQDAPRWTPPGEVGSEAMPAENP